jgi:hypothetical protein
MNTGHDLTDTSKRLDIKRRETLMGEEQKMSPQ